MEAASATMKAVSFLGATVSTTLASPWPQTKLIFCAPNPNTRFSSLSLSRCSTKRNTDTNNETDQNSSFDSNPNLNTENPSRAVSNEAISSSSSSVSRGLVLDLGPVGSWDCKEIGSPVVKRFLGDEEERWYMWYRGVSSGNPGSDSIGLSVSSNGVHWERGKGAAKSSADVGLVMSCGNDWWAFDTKSIRPGEVLIMSSAKVRASSAVYWLYYTGYSSEKVDVSADSSGFSVQNPERFCVDETDKVFRSLPGLAISQDGRHWARIEGEHHSGALFDVGSEREWDSLFIASPQVVFHGNGDLRMYYHSFDVENGEFCIGIARSRDGMKWIKLGKILGGGSKSGCFDELGVINPCVVKKKKDGNYIMAYEGVGAANRRRRSIGLAVSPDGLKDWRRLQEEAVLKPAEKDDGWDCQCVGSPCLVEMDGDIDEWRLYYRGIGNGGRSGIGMAVSDGSDITRFRRWTGFQV
ncbi:hypothetical protein PTKIN_Ptkin02bG0017700 [Pterospermum kingtungense]